MRYEGRPHMGEAVWKQVPHGYASNFGAVDDFSNVRIPEREHDKKMNTQIAIAPGIQCQMPANVWRIESSNAAPVDALEDLVLAPESQRL